MAKVIDFNKAREGRKTATKSPVAPPKAQVATLQKPTANHGWVIWLHCPTCQTLQYTMKRMQGGRYHKCGTLVQEVEVPIDIIAEYTIVKRNMRMLDEWQQKVKSVKKNKQLQGLGSLLDSLRASEQEYLDRLQSISTKTITAHADDWQPDDSLKLEPMPPLGLIYTEARQPQKHFPDVHHEPDGKS